MDYFTTPLSTKKSASSFAKRGICLKSTFNSENKHLDLIEIKLEPPQAFRFIRHPTCCVKKKNFPQSKVVETKY